MSAKFPLVVGPNIVVEVEIGIGVVVGNRIATVVWVRTGAVVNMVSEVL
jgi:hypothetical protein